jgi:hypothetical protein
VKGGLIYYFNAILIYIVCSRFVFPDGTAFVAKNSKKKVCSNDGIRSTSSSTSSRSSNVLKSGPDVHEILKSEPISYLDLEDKQNEDDSRNIINVNSANNFSPLSNVSDSMMMMMLSPGREVHSTRPNQIKAVGKFLADVKPDDGEDDKNDEGDDTDVDINRILRKNRLKIVFVFEIKLTLFL